MFSSPSKKVKFCRWSSINEGEFAKGSFYLPTIITGLKNQQNLSGRNFWPCVSGDEI
jgi:hypothetical protein